MDAQEKLALLSTNNKYEKQLSFAQIISTILVMLPTVPAGMTVAFSAVALPQLNLNLIETSWFASIPTLAAIFGNLSSGFLIDRYGRKNTFYLNSGALIIGCLLLSGPAAITNLYFGQFFCGLSIGAAVVTPTVYVTESIVPDNLDTRSSLASWNVFSICLGISLDFVASLFFDYHQVVLLCAGFSFIFVILFTIFIPESPAWLLQKGRYEEAARARKRLSFGKEMVVVHTSQPSFDDYSIHKNMLTYFKNMKRRDVYKPFFICLLYFFFQQFSGTQVYTAFMVEIIKPTFLRVDPYQLSVVSGFIPLIALAIYWFVLPRTGLRKLGMLSSFMNGVTTFLIGLCFYINQSWHSYSYAVDYVRIFAVWSNTFIATMGLATMPYTIVGEIFPKDVRGLASVPVLAVSIFYFIILMVYPFASKYSPYGIHFFFSMVCFSSIAFIFWYVPETVGRTLQEINDEFL